MRKVLLRALNLKGLYNETPKKVTANQQDVGYEWALNASEITRGSGGNKWESTDKQEWDTGHR